MRLLRMRRVLVAFHGIGFSRASLTVGENGGMKTHYNLLNVELDLRISENCLLIIVLIEYMVESEFL